MFARSHRVHPSFESEQHPTHPTHHDLHYHPQWFRHYGVVGAHHRANILRPESAPLLPAHASPDIAQELNEHRCVSGSPSLHISQTLIHYIPPPSIEEDFHQVVMPPSRRKVDLGLPHQRGATARPTSPYEYTAHSVSPDASRLLRSEDNLSWNDAEQYFHLAEGELSGGSTCAHSVDPSVSPPSFGVANSTSPDTVASISRSKTQSPPSMNNYSQPSPVLRGSRHQIEELIRPQVVAAQRRCRSSHRVSKSSQPAPANLKDLIDRELVLVWAKKEQDSRTLQKLMRDASEDNQQLAWAQIEKDGVQLSCHEFGNYVVQKFLQFGSAALCQQIVSHLQKDIRHMARDRYGCRVVQKAIEVLDLSDKKMLLQCLSEDLPVLVGCQHGNHVIQKFISELPGEHLTPIYRVFDGRVVGHCFQMYGCRVVQRLYVHSTSEFKERMTRDILDHCLRLAKDQWGNYVIQFIIENAPKSLVKQIIDMLLEDFEALSFDKLASNVVEKSVQYATSSAIDLFVKCLLTRSNDELVEFLTHDYGNYVAQTIVDRASFKHGAHKIHRRLKKYGLSQEVKMTTAGRRVISKLDDKMHEYQRSRQRGEHLDNRRR